MHLSRQHVSITLNLNHGFACQAEQLLGLVALPVPTTTQRQGRCKRPQTQPVLETPLRLYPGCGTPAHKVHRHAIRPGHARPALHLLFQSGGQVPCHAHRHRQDQHHRPRPSLCPSRPGHRARLPVQRRGEQTTRHLSSTHRRKSPIRRHVQPTQVETSRVWLKSLHRMDQALQPGRRHQHGLQAFHLEEIARLDPQKV